MLLPITVSAGLVSALSGMFSVNGDEYSSDLIQNIQNMPLLTSTASVKGYDVSAHIESGVSLAYVGSMFGSEETKIHNASSDQISTYVVHKGDTLSQVAEMFGVTVNTIKWTNDIEGNTLKEGDVLVILPISGVKHKVVSGDTISSIAKKYKADQSEIESYNDISKDSDLVVGSTIIIPDGEVVPDSANVSIKKINTPSKNYKGYYIRPIVGGIRSQGIHGYNGVDLASQAGTPILAAAKGEVIISKTGGWNGGYGNYIVIKHDNGTQTLYAHNSQNNVSVGDVVEQGDVIGLMGSSGKSTGTHLHFEIRGAKNPF